VTQLVSGVGDAATVGAMVGLGSVLGGDGGAEEVPGPVSDEEGVEADLPDPIDWWLLSGAEKSTHLVRVAEFTLTLVRSYRLNTEIIVPCWHRHDEMVQELLALLQYRNQQQFIPGQMPGGALNFHEKFVLFCQRMRRWVQEAGCKGNEHIPRGVAPWTVVGSGAFVAAENDRIELCAQLAAAP